MNHQDFWNDNELAQKVLQENKGLKETVEEYNQLKESLEEIEVLIEIGLEESDDSIEKEIEKSISNLEKEIDRVRIKTLLSGDYDKNNAILSINAGTGGLDAQDWAQMLLRMYIRWAEAKGYKVKTLDLLSDPEAGIKSATLHIEGLNAYGYLKSEKGVHRLVRISPFDSNKRRHTTFASVEVIPEFDTSINVEIKDDDLKIDVYRSSGAGGQSVNTTDSAVRITHIPTKIVVTCQNERSQLKNKEKAMQILKNKLYLLTLEKKEKEINSLRGTHMDINFGSQIRSYVMHPYSMVKDHRTNTEDTNVLSVLDGNIDKFIESFLRM